MIKKLVLGVCAAVFMIASSGPADMPIPPCVPGCALNLPVR